MKILVPFKPVPDVAAAASGDGAKWVINYFDEIALEEALRIRERGEAQEVVGVTVAPLDREEQVRAALAMGVDRALRVDDDRSLDPYVVARLLAAVVAREGPSLVLMGKQATDDDAGQVGPMLAGLLNWPQATFVSRVEFIPGAAEVQCLRETDGGVETIAVRLPAVITADLRLNEPRYVSLPGLMKARRRPIEVLSASELGPSLAPRTTILNVQPAPRRTAGVRVESVEELVTRLRVDEKVL